MGDGRGGGWTKSTGDNSQSTGDNSQLSPHVLWVVVGVVDGQNLQVIILNCHRLSLQVTMPVRVTQTPTLYNFLVTVTIVENCHHPIYTDDNS